MSTRCRFIIALLLAATLLGGCGMKGPLYQPTPEQQKKAGNK